MEWNNCIISNNGDKKERRKYSSLNIFYVIFNDKVRKGQMDEKRKILFNMTSRNSHLQTCMKNTQAFTFDGLNKKNEREIRENLKTMYGMRMSYENSKKEIKIRISTAM